MNLGCGFDRREDCLNVDLQPMHRPDVVADAVNLGFLPTGFFTQVTARDVLEHIPRPRIQEALQEWSRVLAPDGVLELQVPNVIGLLEQLKNKHSLEAQAMLLQSLFGTQAYNGDCHFYGFTAPVLAEHLNQAGLRIVRCEAKDGWLFDVSAVKTHGPRAEEENILRREDVFIWGWGPPEQNTHRWCSGRGALSVTPLRGRWSQLTLAIHSPRAAIDFKVHLIDGETKKVLDTVHAPSGGVSSRVIQLQNTADVIEFLPSFQWRPVDYGDGDDERIVSFLVSVQVA